MEPIRPSGGFVRGCVGHYLRYGLRLGAAAGFVNVLAVVAFALLDGEGPLAAQAGSHPQRMFAYYVGSLIAGLLVGLLRAVGCVRRGLGADG